MIDGLDNRLYPLNIVRQNISLVLQDSILFELAPKAAVRYVTALRTDPIAF